MNLGLGVQYMGDFHDATGPQDTSGFASDFVVVSARVGYEITPAAELYLRAENLTNAEYQTARGFIRPTRPSTSASVASSDARTRPGQHQRDLVGAEVDRDDARRRLGARHRGRSEQSGEGAAESAHQKTPRMPK